MEALGSQRLRMMMLELVAWIETGKWRSANGMAALPLAEFASGRLDKRWRKVKKGGAALTQPEAEPRHQLRIEIKKLRYAVEFLASLTKDKEAIAKQERFVSALEEMQEQLGELNDVETARILLSNLLGDEASDADLMRFANRRLESPQTEGEQIAAAQRAHSELLEVGRYWR
jgi:CHAD domain-containing protein